MATTQIHGTRQIKSATIDLDRLAEAVIQADGGQAFTADQSMGGNQLTNVGTPDTGTDAATKDYVDTTVSSQISGLDWKASVRAATTANITLSGTQTIDGVSLSATDRVLVKDQSTGAENGIYVVAAGAWARASDANSSAEVTSGMAVPVTEGTANGDSVFLLTTNDTITLDTTALTFSRLGPTSVTAGAGLTATGNTLDVGAGDGIQVDADSVTVKLDGTTLAKGGSGLKVATDGITATEIAANAVSTAELNAAVAGNGLTGGGGSALAVGTGNGLTTSADAVDLVLDGTSLSKGASGLRFNNSHYVVRETPSGAVNGSNTAYTLANTPATGSEMVFLNGILQEPGSGNDYTISGGTITYETAPVTGDRIRVTYLKS